MQFSTALVALVLSVAANAASTPFRRDDPPTEPGLLHFLTDDCEVTDYDNGEFIAFSNLPPCNGNCGPCLGTSYFRSVIAYSPDSNPLPYDIYVDQDAAWATCGSTSAPTAVKLNTTNTCIKLTDDSEEYAYSLFFKSP